MKDCFVLVMVLTDDRKFLNDEKHEMKNLKGGCLMREEDAYFTSFARDPAGDDFSARLHIVLL